MLACPFCAHSIPGAEKFLGKTGRCPKCGGTYRFPPTADGNTVGVKPPATGAAPAKSPPRPAAAPPPQRPARPAPPRVASPPPVASNDLLLPEEVPVARLDEPSAMPFPMPRPKKVAPTSGISGNVIGGVLVLVLVFGGGGYFGCRKMEAERCRQFNDDLVKTVGRMESFMEPLQPHLSAWQVGNRTDPVQVRAGYEACLASLDEVDKAISALKPPNRPTAQAFAAKAKELIALERDILQKDIKAIVDILCREGLSQEETAKEMLKLAPSALEAKRREEEMAVEFQAAQQAFAKDVGMELRYGK